LSNLALFYASQDRFAEAERLLLQVQAIREKHLPAVHLDTARSLQNLAWLYINQRKQERYEQAKRLLEQSLHIRQICLGPEHPQIATSLHNLAMLYEVQEKYLEAEQLYRQVLTIRRKTMGVGLP
jgi:tetratricopeptide (TPR) repeat protein